MESSERGSEHGELGGSIIAIHGGSEPEQTRENKRAMTEGHGSAVVALVGGIDEPQLQPYKLGETRPSRSRYMTEMVVPTKAGFETKTRTNTDLVQPSKSEADARVRGTTLESRWLSDRAASIEGGIIIPVSGGTAVAVEKDVPQTTMESSWMPQTRPASLETTGGSIAMRAEASVGTVPTMRTAAHVFHSHSVSPPMNDAHESHGRRDSVAKGAVDSTNSMQGLYIAKAAVMVAGSYLAIQLLITFEEVLLPFIFAALLVIILEPLKRFVMRVFNRSALAIFKRFDLKFCMETRVSADHERAAVQAARANRLDSLVSEAGYTYYDLSREDSSLEGFTSENLQAVITPTPGVQKLALIFSIAFCICVTGRVLWLTAKVFVKAGTIISDNSDFYKKGADRLKVWIEEYVQTLNSKAVTFNTVLDDLVNYVEAIGSLVTQSILYVAVQSVVSFIFLIYMMWSPIKMESNTTSQQVFLSTGKYLKVKCLISGFTGICVFISLWAVGLDLPAAFGFLAFLCNFLPALGSVVSSLMPCVLAMLDVRKTPTQVLVALLSQAMVHFFVDFVVEPVFFGLSVEIHSVVVILGIWFFFKVWGVAGMLLSVPLLAIIRLLLKSFKRSALAEQGRDAEAIIFFDNLFEGRWMSAPDEQQVELSELQVDRDGNPRFQSAEPSSGGLWEAILDSQIGQRAAAFYSENRLSIEIGVLVGLVVCLSFPPAL